MEWFNDKFYRMEKCIIRQCYNSAIDGDNITSEGNIKISSNNDAANDPIFTDWEHGDFSSRSSSPCINNIKPETEIIELEATNAIMAGTDGSITISITEESTDNAGRSKRRSLFNND